MKQVLIVEDDPSWQQVLSEILVDMDLAVDARDSLPSALAALRESAYGLAVVDLCLGGDDHHNEDGLRFLEAVRREQPNCRAVLLTGLATPEQEVSVLSKGEASVCLRKENFRRSEFRKIVDEALWSGDFATLE